MTVEILNEEIKALDRYVELHKKLTEKIHGKPQRPKWYAATRLRTLFALRRAERSSK